MNTSSDVWVVSDSIAKHRELMRLPNTLLGGTTAMRQAETLYLPKESMESETAYVNRLEKTVLLNVFSRTVQKLTGEVFQKRLVLQDVPEAMLSWFDNIDMLGNDLTRFCYSVFFSTLVDGVSHILIDYPKTQIHTQNGIDYYQDEDGEWKPLSADVIQKKGWRPNWVHIKAKDILGYKVKSTSTGLSLSQIRIKDSIVVDNGRYSTKVVERIRVIEPNYYEIWELSDSGKERQWVMVDSGKTSLDGIPLVTIRFGEPICFLTCIPPLLVIDVVFL
ncbi:MAG: hypothetical protein HQK77_15030 [Desulfobacterales bacterium]|nr:hypothetical protein [Desulfobacterales bacterium]